MFVIVSVVVIIFPLASQPSELNLSKLVLLLHRKLVPFKVARYSFSGPIPPKFGHKLRHHKQSFGKIATTVVLDKDENLL